MLSVRFTKTASLIWRFYKSFIVASILIDGSCLALFNRYGFSIFVAVFWLKVVTLALTYQFVNAHKKKEYYYYFNLGLSKLIIWIAIIMFEFTSFILMIYFANKFK